MKSTPFLGAFLLFAPLVHAEINPLQKVAHDLAEGIRRQGPLKVAVLAIPHHDNHVSDGPVVVSEQLESFLAQEPKVSVVERQQMDKILAEIHLSESGYLDPQRAKLIGASLRADVIVTGTLINLPDNQCEVNARAMLANNGRIIAASRCLIQRNWDERRRLDQ